MKLLHKIEDTLKLAEKFETYPHIKPLVYNSDDKYIEIIFFNNKDNTEPYKQKIDVSQFEHQDIKNSIVNFQNSNAEYFI